MTYCLNLVHFSHIISNNELMKFNWFLRSQTSTQIQRRIESLLLLVEREHLEQKEKKENPAVPFKKPSATVTSNTANRSEAVSINVDIDNIKMTKDQNVSGKRKINDVEINGRASKKQKTN